MRRIYLVRHGLTLANGAGVIQDTEDALHPRGIEQAHALAQRLSKLPFDTLVSSDLPRARHTADIIAQKTGCAPAHSPLLRETPYPSVLFGKERMSAEVLDYYREKDAQMDDPGYRFGDEETYADIRARAAQAIEYLAGLEGTVVAVSHGNFIRRMVLGLLFENTLTERQELPAMTGMLTTNTGITALELREGRWRLVTWNDHAHLG